ncbi:hypothetical protein WUBG_16014, partial [Wuchereria bancrofti]
VRQQRFELEERQFDEEPRKMEDESDAISVERRKRLRISDSQQISFILIRRDGGNMKKLPNFYSDAVKEREELCILHVEKIGREAQKTDGVWLFVTGENQSLSL